MGWRILRYAVRGHLPWVGLAIVVAAVAAAERVGLGVMVQITINALGRHETVVFEHRIAEFAGLAIAVAATSFAQDQVRSILGNKIAFSLRSSACHALVSARDMAVHTLEVGQVVSRVVDDPGRVSEAVVAALMDVVTVGGMGVGSLAYIASNNPTLALLALALGPLPMVALAVTVRLQAVAERTHHHAIDVERTVVTDVHEGYIDYKVRCLEDLLLKRARSAFQGHYDSSRRFDIVGGLGNGGGELLNLLSVVAAYTVAGIFVIQGSISLGFLVAFMQLAQQVQRPFMMGTSLARRITSGLVAASRLHDILRLPPEEPMASPLTPEVPNTRRGAAHDATGLAFICDGVSYRYPEEAGHRDVRIPSFAVGPGDHALVTGPNGAGKSTLLKVMLGLLSPSTGGVRWSTGEGSWSELRNGVCVVTQEPHILPGTVRENLDPKGRYCDDHLESAVSKVGLDGTLREAGGLDCRLGPGGRTLSRGERQRMALARVLVEAEKEFVILDEPFTALDETDRLGLVQVVRGALQGKGAVVILHRRDEEWPGMVEVRLGAPADLPGR